MKESKFQSQRQLKVGELIRHGMAEIFAEGKLYDAELPQAPLTVTEVRVSPDLHNATAFVIPLGGTKEPEALIRVLKRLAPQIRMMLAKKVKLRFAPEINFRIDDSFDRASHVEQLFQTLDAPVTPAK